jgi:CRP-like cAMP-binding protein
MASTALSRDYAHRDVIFVAGDLISEVLLLTKGLVKLLLFSEDGAEVILRLCASGDVVYPQAMVPEDTYSSTAQTLQGCRLLAWDARTFHAAGGRFPALRCNVERILEQRIRELERRFREACTRKASPRLAQGLLHLMDRIGHQVDDHVEIRLTHESLAQMTAMAPETVTRVLAKWEKQGFVSLRREAIEVRNPSGLFDQCRVE